MKSKTIKKPGKSLKQNEKTKSRMRCCSGRMVFGTIFIIFGFLFLFKTMGILDFSIFNSMKTYWPVGLIFIGIALMLRQRLIALLLFGCLLFVGGAFIIDNASLHHGETREIIQEIVPTDEITTASLEISYGAGDVKISAGETGYVVRNQVNTNDLRDPEVDIDKEDNHANIEINRKSSGGNILGHGLSDEWDMLLDEDVAYEINLEYGAADMKVDLRDLKVDKLNTEFGAASTEITFEDYPTITSIEAGASSITLKFPEGAGVIIDIESGLTSTNFDGFKKQNGKYYSDNYTEGGENIIVDIEVGAADIDAYFYD